MVQLPKILRERNVVKKDWRKVKLRIALCYPNVYAAGMTSLATHLLYYLFNRRDDVACERVFYEANEVPYSLESRQPLSRFDIVAFSLQFEVDYTHAVEMLLRSGIPPLAAERRRPWVIAGGPCAMENPFPMLPFVDVFLIGDLEPVCDSLLDALIQAKSQTELDSLLGEVFFLSGRNKAQRAIISNLDEAPHSTCQVLPEPPYPSTMEPAFGRSLLVEVSRGCNRRCNFCLTSYQNSPCRERSLTTLENIIDEGVYCTGVEKIALIASGITDYSQFGSLINSILSRGLHLSIPALRADLADLSILEMISQGGQRTLTLAPEAGSQGLRDILAKGIPDIDFNNIMEAAIKSGFNMFKLYFLIGLPTETEEDITAISKFSKNLQKISPQRHRLHVSVSPFIPKPHTPFQWFGLTPLPILKKRLSKLKKELRVGRMKLDLANPRWSVIQSALSKGTSDLAPLILAVAQEGRQTAGTWFHAAKELGINLETLATKQLSTQDSLPWEILDVGIERNTLLRRFRKLA